MSPPPGFLPVATAPRVALGLALILGLGAIVVWGLVRSPAGSRGRRPRLSDLALAWGAGVAVAVPAATAASLAGLPLRGRPLALLLAGLVALAALLVVVRGRSRGAAAPPLPAAAPAAGGEEPRWALWLGRGVLLAAVALLLWKLAVVQTWSWDFFVDWGLRARGLAAAGGPDRAMLARTAGEAVRGYPLGFPYTLVLAGLGALPGAALAKVVHALFALGLVALVRDAARRLAGSPLVGEAAAAWVALSPVVWDSEAWGLADPPLAFFAVAALAVVVAARPAPPAPPGDAAVGTRGPLLLAGLLCGFLPWVKSEGLPLAALVAAVAAFWLAWPWCRRGRADLAAFAAPAGLLTVAEVVFRATVLPPDPGFLGGDAWSRLVLRRGAVPQLLARMGHELLLHDWMGFWPLFAAGAVAALVLRHRRALPLAALVSAQMAIYAGAILASVYPPLDQIRSAAFRVSAGLEPVGVLALVALLGPGATAPARRGRIAAMSDGASRGPMAALHRFAARLRYPQLFFLTAALFVVDLAVPDLVPFADEILLGLLTLLLGRLRERDRDTPGPDEPEVKNVTPPGGGRDGRPGR